MTTAPFDPVLRNQADVEQMWITLINPLGWHCPRFYLLRIGSDDRPCKVVAEIDEVELPFTSDDADSLFGLLARLSSDAGELSRWALLFCRPGAGGLTEADRATCTEAYAAARRHDVEVEVIHVATDTLIVPAPMDSVMA
jgi:hypothetical protein